MPGGEVFFFSLFFLFFPPISFHFFSFLFICLFLLFFIRYFLLDIFYFFFSRFAIWRPATLPGEATEILENCSGAAIWTAWPRRV